MPARRRLSPPRPVRDHRARGFSAMGCPVQIMPYATQGVSINPFDLTKTWPHGDYPLVPVGTMTLTAIRRFLRAYRAGALLPATPCAHRLSPDKMLLAVRSAITTRSGTGSARTSRCRSPAKGAGEQYMMDVPMNYQHTGSAPVYVPNSAGRPWPTKPGPSTMAGKQMGDGAERLHATLQRRRLHPPESSS